LRATRQMMPPAMEIPALVRLDASPPPASIGHAYGFPEHGSAGVWAEGKLSGVMLQTWILYRPDERVRGAFP